MQTVPTDVIANELAIRLFLFGLAALSFYEALKLERHRAYIAWFAFALFLASGAALTPISNAWPVGVSWLSRLVSNPVTWFVLLTGAYLALRPRWVSVPPAGLAISAPFLTAYDDAQIRSEIASLGGRVGALMNMVAAQHRLQKLNEANEYLSDAWNTLKGAAGGDWSASPKMRGGAYGPALIASHFERSLDEFEERLATLVGRKVDLTSTPNYSRNPMTKVATENDTMNDAQRLDWRRTEEKAQTALSSLGREIAAMQQQRDAAVQAIAGVAQ